MYIPKTPKNPNLLIDKKPAKPPQKSSTKTPQKTPSNWLTKIPNKNPWVHDYTIFSSFLLSLYI
jgi:hypothetical protein